MEIVNVAFTVELTNKSSVYRAVIRYNTKGTTEHKNKEQ